MSGRGLTTLRSGLRQFCRPGLGDQR